jgi:flagellar protein FliS
MNAAVRYTSTQNQTASKERTMVLLFQGAMREMRLAEEALVGGRALQANAALGKASKIVMQLHGTLDRSRAPQLCETLAALYRFVAFRLLDGLGSRNPERVREAIRVFEPLVDAFQQAVLQVAAGAKR